MTSLVVQTIKNLPAVEEKDSICVSRSSPGEENGYSLQYSCLENSMDRGTWRATIHGVSKN